MSCSHGVGLGGRAPRAANQHPKPTRPGVRVGDQAIKSPCLLFMPLSPPPTTPPQPQVPRDHLRDQGGNRAEVLHHAPPSTQPPWVWV
jgi:hypothetical protein